MSKEIEFQQLEIDLCNKKIGEAKEMVESKLKEIEQTETLITERQEDLNEKRGELDEILQETREEEAKLKEKAEDYEKKIEPRLLSSFLRIRKKARNGLGIVYVQRDACGGCFNKIPSQRQLDIKMHKKIIVCEYCGRILIDPELAGVKADKPADEEKPKRRRSIRKKKTEETEQAHTIAGSARLSCAPRNVNPHKVHDHEHDNNTQDLFPGDTAKMPHAPGGTRHGVPMRECPATNAPGKRERGADGHPVPHGGLP